MLIYADYGFEYDVCKIGIADIKDSSIADLSGGSYVDTSIITARPKITIEKIKELAGVDKQDTLETVAAKLRNYVYTNTKTGITSITTVEQQFLKMPHEDVYGLSSVRLTYEFPCQY